MWGSNREGSDGLIDIWGATRSGTGQGWSVPRNLGTVINSGADDRGPSISPNGHTLYFTSKREGARQGDVYMATRLTRR